MAGADVTATFTSRSLPCAHRKNVATTDVLELVNGECEMPGCKGTLVQGCYLTNYTQCDNTYMKYETEYIQCGVSGPNCLSEAVCKGR
mmetsp:Transcript_6506/g.9083  ORF Transcript_6506/g.9083 Transcript_6506/m.9083 type:complete len:88 (-) Transcript_6506:23-286(-)